MNPKTKIGKYDKFVDIIKIESFEDYFKCIRDYNYHYFRGQENSIDWVLEPKIARKPMQEIFKRSGFAIGLDGWISFENHIIDRFQRLSAKYLKQIPKHKIDWLVLGQHYGLPTRLLDWSENPIIALFFALGNIYEKSKSEGCVWVIPFHYGPLWKMDIDLDNLSGLQFYFPRLLENRINYQRSCFTILPFPRERKEKFKSIEDIIMEWNDPDNFRLTKILIPNDTNIKKEMFRNINDLGFDYDYIYADMTGLSKQIIYELMEDRMRF